tara:strand:- start:615 stop:1136 length:522 start_codon:yes stop_codon:yes gene_type:complete
MLIVRKSTGECQYFDNHIEAPARIKGIATRNAGRVSKGIIEVFDHNSLTRSFLVPSAANEGIFHAISNYPTTSNNTTPRCDCEMYRIAGGCQHVRLVYEHDALRIPYTARYTSTAHAVTYYCGSDNKARPFMRKHIISDDNRELVVSPQCVYLAKYPELAGGQYATPKTEELS